MGQVRLAGITRGDTANSFNGLGMVLWFQGCSIRCKGCQNPSLIPMVGGTDYDVTTVVGKVSKEVYWLQRESSCVVFLGGEPTDQLSALLELNGLIKSMNIRTVLYTGRTEEELVSMGITLSDFDIIKVGKYDENRVSTGSRLISKNQYLIVEGKRHANKTNI